MQWQQQRSQDFDKIKHQPVTGLGDMTSEWHGSYRATLAWPAATAQTLDMIWYVCFGDVDKIFVAVDKNICSSYQVDNDHYGHH